MNYYQIFLKNGNEVFVEADYFYETGSPNVLLFFNKNNNENELVACFKMKEIIGCTKINKEEVDEVLNFWKENDNNGERHSSKN